MAEDTKKLVGVALNGIAVEVPADEPFPFAAAETIVREALETDERIRLVYVDRRDVLIER